MRKAEDEKGKPKNNTETPTSFNSSWANTPRSNRTETRQLEFGRSRILSRLPDEAKPENDGFDIPEEEEYKKNGEAPSKTDDNWGRFASVEEMAVKPPLEQQAPVVTKPLASGRTLMRGNATFVIGTDGSVSSSPARGIAAKAPAPVVVANKTQPVTPEPVKKPIPSVATVPTKSATLSSPASTSSSETKKKGNITGKLKTKLNLGKKGIGIGIGIRTEKSKAPQSQNNSPGTNPPSNRDINFQLGDDENSERSPRMNSRTFGAIPAEFPPRPPDPGEFPSSLTRDIYKAYMRRKFLRETWENALLAYRRKEAAGDVVAMEKILVGLRTDLSTQEDEEKEDPSAVPPHTDNSDSEFNPVDFDSIQPLTFNPPPATSPTPVPSDPDQQFLAFGDLPNFDAEQIGTVEFPNFDAMDFNEDEWDDF
uniref:Uncharacterized protein n=1 Tax=Arcella intermedia TaxID=1963864 RepID=A0A6B2L170_9EUKA